MAAPSVRDAILGAALSRAGLLGVPDESTALREFVQGSFRKMIADRLGDDVAEGVLGELAPMLGMLARIGAPTPRSSVRPKRTGRPLPPPDSDDASGVMLTPAAGKTMRSSDFLPVIIAVVRTSSSVRALAIALAGRAVVRPVVDLMEMAEAVEDHRAERPVVLFDCSAPAFHLESVATFASELPTGSWLALLDPTSEQERTARTFSGATLTVVKLSRAIGADTLAQRCIALFD